MVRIPRGRQLRATLSAVDLVDGTAGCHHLRNERIRNHHLDRVSSPATTAASTDDHTSRSGCSFLMLLHRTGGNAGRSGASHQIRTGDAFGELCRHAADQVSNHFQIAPRARVDPAGRAARRILQNRDIVLKQPIRIGTDQFANESQNLRLGVATAVHLVNDSDTRNLNLRVFRTFHSGTDCSRNTEDDFTQCLTGRLIRGATAMRGGGGSGIEQGGKIDSSGHDLTPVWGLNDLPRVDCVGAVSLVSAFSLLLSSPFLL